MNDSSTCRQVADTTSRYEALQSAVMTTGVHHYDLVVHFQAMSNYAIKATTLPTDTRSVL
jgi:hypothetical protein